ncbi:MAG: ArnT family glycosyltransferase, partial [Gemmatimonadales bacterium]
MRIITAVVLFLAGSSFVLMAGRAIDLPGLQYDEILFVNAATGGPTNGLFVRRILGLPLMVMPYMGALKAYLYYPVFKLFGVSPATSRWPVIILSLVTLGLLYGVARTSFGRLTSALLVLVVAVDPAFIYTTKLDVGPTALMMLLKLAALFFALRTVTTGSPRYLWGLSATCALGIFDKLNFIWFVIALGIACGLLFRRELAAAWRRDPPGFLVPTLGLALFTIAACVLLVIPQFLGSQAEMHQLSLLDHIRYVLGLYAETMDGRWMYFRVTKRELTAHGMTNYLVAAAILGLCAAGVVAARRAGGVTRLRLRSRIVACHLLLFLIIGLQVWLTKKAWGAHHVMMLYPFQYFIAFGAVASLAGLRSTLVAATLFVASSLNADVSYARALNPGAEFEPQWSPVIYSLVDYLNHQPVDRIISVDWGIHNQIFALGTPRTRAVTRDLWPRFRALGNRQAQEALYHEDVENRTVLAILHGRGWDIMPSTRENFASWATSFGLTPVLVRTFLRSEE